MMTEIFRIVDKRVIGNIWLELQEVGEGFSDYYGKVKLENSKLRIVTTIVISPEKTVDIGTFEASATDIKEAWEAIKK